VPARVLLFSLDELRRRYGGLVRPGADPRADTAPFRAFRAALLAAAARGACSPCELTFWWEGTFNGYVLAVAVRPPDALAALDLGEVCPLEDERIAPPPPERQPLASVVPGRAEVAAHDDGSVSEAPFGAAAGHFGAPGIRRLHQG